ncbi:hypothetical protein ACIRSU_32835 [Streptomyces sp. NPDC101160]|uniref:hypothetical protein n=1 Tax=Streptomyces sp. NPDC101160 TaxID=3366118 RepID=UPI0038071982
MTERTYSAAWQKLLEQAGQSRDGTTTAHMSLASAGDGAADGDLRHSAGPWTKAAGVAESLSTSMATARSRLTSAHQGVAAGTVGLASVGTLKTVLTSWEERLAAVKDECGSLGPALRRVAKEQGEQDVSVKAAFSGVHGLSDAKAK